MTAMSRASRGAFAAFAILALMLAAPILTATGARAELHIDITHGQTQPLPIASYRRWPSLDHFSASRSPSR